MNLSHERSHPFRTNKSHSSSHEQISLFFARTNLTLLRTNKSHSSSHEQISLFSAQTNLTLFRTNKSFSARTKSFHTKEFFSHEQISLFSLNLNLTCSFPHEQIFLALFARTNQPYSLFRSNISVILSHERSHSLLGMPGLIVFSKAKPERTSSEPEAQIGHGRRGSDSVPASDKKQRRHRQSVCSVLPRLFAL